MKSIRRLGKGMRISQPLANCSMCSWWDSHQNFCTLLLQRLAELTCLLLLVLILVVPDLANWGRGWIVEDVFYDILLLLSRKSANPGAELAQAGSEASVLLLAGDPVANAARAAALKPLAPTRPPISPELTRPAELSLSSL